ncbi:hypothetical protein A2865_03090 [Candidatus Woesebacteria bacterium RIFCSPHIGHO2_01_FULL_39_17]|uniref:Serine protease n=3 Tax=Candidatus Woeseibacteriota TaxID=1752722 RepID=A0A0G0NDI6_9BACT|nr:MAG: serine protease precursor [Microgenomates group bacterium GW2011_GWC1_38_12]KKQ94109.1 MAG: serine protease precursor [Candidatus Woesebacteria bacterium GW2011_GWB1_39_10b]KKR13568.1 MAG: serine protease precursor [Candidatus Woesebacteria bacterium GW2011_GWA1_39_21b]OGM22548.1 MAG: hypothetical protein A2865_03090 [Candidatus Woesebacteria bacterium RIFCSPHIGHO2_01_FULL_39_17]OGM63671.1 MAG: hypothetical protein A3A52_02505 [Candidatus Woesebacteria bacterium RIFCSPLOWO2_01_FULL_39_1
MKKVILLVLLIFFALTIFKTTSFKETIYASKSVDIESERLIVKFRRFTPNIFREKALESAKANYSEDLRLSDTKVIQVPKGEFSNAAKTLKKNIFVEYVEQDFIAETQEMPNDPYFPNQWGLEKINAKGGWDKSHGLNSIDVAIVDTGVNNSHPDLAGKISASVNCIYSSCPGFTTNDPDGHGTHVAGIAAGITNNSQGIAGLLWEGRIMSVKALDDTGNGYYSWIANGIVWAADNGAEVINLSLGGNSNSSTLANAVTYAWNKGSVLVAAAGNSSSTSPKYPAYFSNVIAVSATDQNDAKAYFSNYGSWVELAAPGVSILSTYENGYEYLSGTSMATPFVSGLAALIFAQNPLWDNKDVRTQIESTADKIDGTESFWQFGRINVCKALGCIISGLTPTPTPGVLPTATLTPTSNPTPIPSLTPTLTSTPTLTPTPSPTPSVTPTPTPQNLPWWCKYVPWHYTCQ